MRKSIKILDLLEVLSSSNFTSCVFTIHSKLGLTVGTMNECIFEYGNIERNSKILYVTLPFSFKIKSLRAAREHFSKYFKMRKRSDEEVWILGIEGDMVDHDKYVTLLFHFSTTVYFFFKYEYFKPQGIVQ